jgi:hypothetical protein
MKTLDAAKIRDIAEALTSKAMLPVMAMLTILFFEAYMEASVLSYTITVNSHFTCAYAQRRIVNRVPHHRKFALFPGCARQDYIE